MIHQKNNIITDDLSGGTSAAIKLQASRYNAKNQTAALEALKEELEKIRIAIGLTEIDYTPNCNDIVYGLTENLTISVLEADKIGIESVSIQDTAIAEIVSNSEAIDGTQKIFSYQIKPLKIGKTKFLALLTSKLKINTLVEIDINVISDTVELTINGAPPETIYLKEGETQTLNVYHKTKTPSTLHIAAANEYNLSVSNRVDIDENNLTVDITGNAVSEEFLDFTTSGTYIGNVVNKVNVIIESAISTDYNGTYEDAMRELRNYVILYPKNATGTQTLYVNSQTHANWAAVQTLINTKNYSCVIVDCTFNSTNVGFGLTTGEYITLSSNYAKVIQGENSRSIRVESTCTIDEYFSSTNASKSCYDENIMSESYSPSYYGDINYLKGNIVNMTGGKILRMESGSIDTANYVLIRWKNSGRINTANYCSIFYHNKTSTNANYINNFNDSLIYYHNGDYISTMSGGAIMNITNTARIDKLLSGIVNDVQANATITSMSGGCVVKNQGTITKITGGYIRTSTGTVGTFAGGAVGENNKNPYTSLTLYIADAISDAVLNVSGSSHSDWASVQAAINSKNYGTIIIDETFKVSIDISAGHFSEILLGYYPVIKSIAAGVEIDKLTHIGGYTSSKNAEPITSTYNIIDCLAHITDMYGGTIQNFGISTSTSKIDNMYGGAILYVYGSYTTRNNGSIIKNMYGGVVINLLNGAKKYAGARIKNMYGGYVHYFTGSGYLWGGFIEHLYGGTLNNIWSNAWVGHFAGGRINYIRDGFQNPGAGYIPLMTGGNIGYIETSITGSSKGALIMKMEGGMVINLAGGGALAANNDAGGVNSSAVVFHMSGGAIHTMRGGNSSPGARVMNMSGGYVYQGTNATNKGTIDTMTGGGIGNNYLTVGTASSPAKVGSFPTVVVPTSDELAAILNIANSIK